MISVKILRSYHIFTLFFLQSEMMAEAALSKFKAQMQSSQVFFSISL